MEYIPAKTIVRPMKDKSWFGYDYGMNLYRGCCHGCIYCDSRSDCYQIREFDQVQAKEDALLTIRDELRRKVKKGVVGTGAMGDAYNPFEREELLTRHALELISAFGFGAGILTKGDLILRDVDILTEIKEHSPVICMETVTTTDDWLSAKIEPGAPVSSVRFSVIDKLRKEGVFAGVVMTPVLPFLEDRPQQLKEMIRMAQAHGASFLYASFGVTLRDGQRAYYYDKLETLFPGQEFAKRYEKAYGSRYHCSSSRAARLWSILEEECEKAGLLFRMKDIIHTYKKNYSYEQLSLFD